jgi:hypothetical protein
MVGHTITLADISVCCALVDGLTLVLDPDFRKPYGNLMRWFDLCLAQPEFKAVLGDVKLCGGAAKAKAAPKEAAPKKEPAPKKEAAPKKEEKKEKKEEGGAKEPTPEELEKMKKDKLKKTIKEGGKRGVEIEGAADMGGLQFFCTSMEVPEGDLDLLVRSMAAMNEKSDPSEEERKGGSGHIGKMIFSAGVDQLAVVAYVPEEKQADLVCKEWLEAVLALFGGSVKSVAKDVCSGVVLTDGNKGIFPLKIRESMILEANNFLRKLGLFPEDKDSDDDDPVFGDDDFPSM